MADLQHLVGEFLSQISLLELTAVVFGLLYLLLAARENILCWYAAFVSTAVSIVVFLDVQLLMESALQVYYLLMAVYGWYQWRHGGVAEEPLDIGVWAPTVHLLAILAVIVIAAGNGFLLAENTGAAWPYLDSFTTWASVLTTYMVARKILENWIYWIVIDGLSIFLYLERGLYLYAGLFVIYVIIAAFGFVEWRRRYQCQESAVPLTG